MTDTNPPDRTTVIVEQHRDEWRVRLVRGTATVTVGRHRARYKATAQADQLRAEYTAALAEHGLGMLQKMCEGSGLRTLDGGFCAMNKQGDPNPPCDGFWEGVERAPAHIRHIVES